MCSRRTACLKGNVPLLCRVRFSRFKVQLRTQTLSFEPRLFCSPRLNSIYSKWRSFVTLQMSFLSLLISLMHPCWIKCCVCKQRWGLVVAAHISMVTTEVFRGAGMRGMLGAFEQKSSEMHSLALKSWIVNVLIRDGISRLPAPINIPAFHRSLKVIDRDIIRRRSHLKQSMHAYSRANHTLLKKEW